jgi:hypothetical protein
MPKLLPDESPARMKPFGLAFGRAQCKTHNTLSLQPPFVFGIKRYAFSVKRLNLVGKQSLPARGLVRCAQR